MCYHSGLQNLFCCFGLFFLVGFWTTPGCIQSFTLGSPSGMPPGGARGTLWNDGDRTPFDHVQSQCPPQCAITSAPVQILYLYEHLHSWAGGLGIPFASHPNKLHKFSAWQTWVRRIEPRIPLSPAWSLAHGITMYSGEAQPGASPMAGTQ